MSEAISSSASALAETSEAHLDLLQQISAGSTHHGAQLGGAWTPPSYATATPSTTQVAADSPQLVDLLVLGAQEATEQAGMVEGDTSRLLISISVWRYLAASQLAETSQDEVTVAVPEVDLVPVQLTSLPECPELIRGLDAASYAYEAVMARSENETQYGAWEDRIARLRESANALATSAGMAGTPSDPRQATYDVSAILSLSEADAIASLESDIATLWVNADLPGDMAELQVGAATAAFLRAQAAGATQPLDSAAAVLPGLAR